MNFDIPSGIARIFAKIFRLAVATVGAPMVLALVPFGVNAISEALGRCAREAQVRAWRKRRQDRKYRE